MCCLLGAIVILSGAIRLLVNAGDLAVAGLKKLVSYFLFWWWRFSVLVTADAGNMLFER